VILLGLVDDAHASFADAPDDSIPGDPGRVRRGGVLAGPAGARIV
jgi:hypothetical protein